MDIKNAQQAVDAWIKEHGVRYFNELTNMAQLTEEVGEVARIIARRYARQGSTNSHRRQPRNPVGSWFSIGTRGTSAKVGAGYRLI